MAELLLVLRFVLAGLLYAFLAVAFYIMWRGMQQRAQQGEQTVEPALLSMEQDGCPTQRFPLRAVTAIGRSADNHLVVDDPYASGNHAIVAWRDGGWWLEDLGSHNGTYLNEEQIADPTALAPGDRVRIGETTLRFESEGTQTT